MKYFSGQEMNDPLYRWPKLFRILDVLLGELVAKFLHEKSCLLTASLNTQMHKIHRFFYGPRNFFKFRKWNAVRMASAALQNSHSLLPLSSKAKISRKVLSDFPESGRSPAAFSGSGTIILRHTVRRHISNKTRNSRSNLTKTFQS